MPMITPEILLQAYAAGIFPMAESADDDAIYWIDPDERGVIPLETFHVPRRLRRTVRARRFTVRIDTAFEEVLEACGQSTHTRPTTWINRRIKTLYSNLFDLGHCHSVECWRDGKLVGGLYGVRLGAAFFGESMFSRETDASKVALVHLAARLISGGFALLDTQFVTEHLTQFGAIEVPRDDYRLLLEKALTQQADFHYFHGDDQPDAVLQPVSQTS